jgi:protein O-GlcNAc transferase
MSKSKIKSKAVTVGRNKRMPAAIDVAALWQQLALSPTQAPVWLALAQGYAGQGLPWQAGYTARQALRCDATLGSALKALKLTAWQDVSAGDALLGRTSLPEAAALAQRFAVQVQACAGDWLSWLYLSRLQEMAAAAIEKDALLQAQSLEPLAGESLHWMGVWRLNAGDAAGAVAALSGLLDIRPVRFGSMMMLGEALLRTGQTAAAEKAFARASLSDNPDFLQTLSARVFQHNYWQEAVEVLNKALALRPKSVSILLALSKIHWEVYDLTRAQDCCRQVLTLEPSNEEVSYMLAALPGRMGDAKGHFEAVRSKLAASADPGSRLASSVAMAALYHDALSAQTVADLHRSLCAPIEAALVAQPNFQNTCEAGRRLRVGYVTGDFHRQHPVNIFMLPVLQRHDHDKVEVFVYHTGTMHDDYTRQAQACADHWLEAVKLDDKALQHAIVADKIDILIDLAGHTSSHRLGVLALRAAPVQATFLGYPHSTGLSTIDWLVGDATVSPTEHAHLFSEGIAQMPGSVFCWAPVDDYPLPPARPAGAPLVFGSFNNAMKLSPTTVALWARVLQAVPGSQLLLKAPSLRDAAVQARFTALFEAQGIAAERLMLRGPSGLADMMQEYGDMDIALDPTPYNGGTTTLQALWMGVPVVALRGGNFVSRMGASFLQTLGRPAWLADDWTAYVSSAAALAAQVERLRGQRAELRAQMAASPLCDITTYVSDFEALLQRMWALYCVGDKSVVICAGAHSQVDGGQT